MRDKSLLVPAFMLGLVAGVQLVLIILLILLVLP